MRVLGILTARSKVEGHLSVLRAEPVAPGRATWRRGGGGHFGGRGGRCACENGQGGMVPSWYEVRFCALKGSVVRVFFVAQQCKRGDAILRVFAIWISGAVWGLIFATPPAHISRRGVESSRSQAQR